MLFAYFMLGGGIFLFTPARLTSKLQLAYAHLFRGPLETGRVVTLSSRPPANTETVGAEDYSKLVQMIQRQRNHVANLEAQLDVARHQIQELTRMNVEPEWNRMRLLPAGIINDPGHVQNSLLINYGHDDGVAVGQFVLGDRSVIGMVSDVSARTARVRLITDPKSRIAVRVGGSKARGVMEGRGPDSAVIPQLSADRQPEAGDHVFALKTPGFPNVPIITAEVVESRRDPETPMLWEITVRPVCDIANLLNVVVVMSGP
jgi:cell shape-determining protein MreC